MINDDQIQLHNVTIKTPHVHEKHDTTERLHFDNVSVSSVSSAGAEFPSPV